MGHVVKYSVIVPFLNEEAYLRSCVESLLNQTVRRDAYELIFVDNGSTDRSREILDGYPGLVVLREPLPDAYLARNLGIQRACGEVLLFTDADCTVSPNWIESFARNFSAASIDIAIGKLTFPAEAGRFVEHYVEYNAAKMSLMASILPREVCYAHAGNMAVRATVFDSLGLFPPMPIVGDAEIVQRYLRQNPDRRMGYVPDAVVTHLEVASSSALLRKLYRYGRYAATFSGQCDFRLTSTCEKFVTLRTCFSQKQYTFWSKIEVLLALAVHNVAFALGCAHARFGN